MLLSFVHVRVLELGGRPPRSRHGGARNRSATSELTGAAMSCLGRSHRLRRACCAPIFSAQQEDDDGLFSRRLAVRAHALPRPRACAQKQGQSHGVRWDGEAEGATRECEREGAASAPPPAAAATAARACRTWSRSARLTHGWTCRRATPWRRRPRATASASPRRAGRSSRAAGATWSSSRCGTAGTA